MIVLLGVLLTLLVLFSSVTGGVLGMMIVTLSVAAAILLIALQSYLRPEVFHEALWKIPRSLTDPRSVFARAARAAPTGEILVSYTRYRKVYRATLITVGVLLLFLGVAIVLALLRAGYPR
ncbi:MAG: hypothetical protein G01um101438_106 [Parcubacteria group bacterium Gr01-1014_38]|nr:MAG: hypothetical protein G01um101438_106 [Parcubacteria group bacterium Gr01-1014_38]